MDAAARSTERSGSSITRTFQKVGQAARGLPDRVSITLTADEGNAERSIAELKRRIADVDGENVRITTNAETGKATASLQVLEHQVSDLQGETINLDVDTSSISRMGQVSGGLRTLSGNIRAFQTVAASVIGVPALIAGLGGLVPVAVAASGAILRLGGAIGQAFVGAAAAGAGAAGILGGALAAVIAPLKMTLGSIDEYKTGLDGAKSAQQAAASSAQTYADAQRQVGQATDDAAYAQQQAAQQIQDAEDATEDSRETHESAIQSLIAAEQELADVREDEPQRIEQLRINEERTAIERQQAADAYNEAVRRYGANSEEAREASLDLRQAELDETTATEDLADARRNGTDELNSAKQAVTDASDAEKDAREGVQDAIENEARTREEAARQVEQAQEAVEQAQRAAAQAADDAAAAQASAAEETVSLTAAQHALLNAWEHFAARADAVFQPAQDAVSLLGVEVLRLGEDYLPRLAQTSEAAVAGLGRAFDTVSGLLAGRAEQGGINTFLEAVRRNSETAYEAAGRLTLALFNVFSRTIPFGEKLIDITADLITRFHEWTRNVSGQNTIDQFLAGAYRQFQRLMQVTQNLGAALGNLFVGLGAGSGGLTRAMQSLVGFSEALRRASENTGRMSSFMKAAQPALSAMYKLGGEAARQVLILANNLIKAGQQGGKIGTLAKVINALAASLKPIRVLLQETFVALGPVLADLIPDVVKFLGNFLGETGGLVRFLSAIDGILEAFNALPAPIREAAAEMVFWGTVLKGLGITAIVGTLTRLAGTFLAVRVGASSAATALGGGGAGAGLLGGLRSLGVLLAGGLGLGLLAGGLYFAYQRSDTFKQKVDELAGSLKNTLVSAAQSADAALKDIFDEDTKAEPGTPMARQQLQGEQLGLREPTGPDSVSAWEEAGKKLGNALASGITAAIGLGGGEGGGFGTPEGRNFALNFLTGVRSSNLGERIRSWFVKEMAAELNPTASGGSMAFIGQFFDKQGISGAIRQAFSGINLAGVGGALLQSLKQEFLRVRNVAFGLLKNMWSGSGGIATIGRSIGQGLSKAFSGIAKTASSVWNSIRKTATAAWNGIRSSVSSAWNGIRGVIQKGANGARSVVTGGWNAVRKVTQSVWNGVRSVVTSVWNGIRGVIQKGINIARSVVTGGWNAVRRVTQNVWNGIRNLLTSVWNAIRSLIQKGINIARSVVTGGWNAIRNVTQSVWNAIKGALTAVWNAIKGVFTTALNTVKKLVSSAWNWLKSQTTSAYEAVRKTIQSKLTAAKSAVTAAVNGMKTAFSNAWKNIKAGAIAFGEGLKKELGSRVQGAVSTVKGWLGDLCKAAGSVLDALGLDGGKLTSLGNSLGGGGTKSADARAPGGGGAGGGGGRGRRRSGPRKMARGGIVRPGGFAGTPTVLYGEAGEEIYARTDRYTPESARAMAYGISKWAQRGWLDKIAQMARGGVLRHDEKTGQWHMPGEERHGRTRIAYGMPPEQSWDLAGKDGVLGYRAVGAVVKAVGGAARQWGEYMARGSDVTFTQGDIPGGAIGRTTSAGNSTLEVINDAVAAHEAGHGLKLGHGGSGIMKAIVSPGMRVTSADKAKVAEIYGKPTDKKGKKTERVPTGRGGGRSRGGGGGGIPGGGGRGRIGPNIRDILRGIGGLAGRLTHRMARGGILGSTGKEGLEGQQEQRGTSSPNSLTQAIRGQMGGIGGPGGTTNWEPWVAAIAKRIVGAFPGISANTYPNHGGRGTWGELHSADYWGGARGTPVGGDRGDAIASYNLQKFGKDIMYYIWKGQIHGWGTTKPYNDASDMHFDHVHSTYDKGANLGGPGGSGGGAPFDWMSVITSGLSKVPSLNAGGGVFGSALSQLAPKYIGYAKDYLIEQAKKFFGQAIAGIIPGGKAGRGQAEEWVSAGYKAANAFKETSANVAKTMNLAWEESGWDPSAVNPISVGGEHATGFLQMLPSTFKSYQQSGMGDIMNAVHNTAASLRYQMARYGYPKESAPYSEGGIVMKDQLIRAGEKGMREAVLPLDNQRARENVRASLGFDVMEAKLDHLVSALTQYGIVLADVHEPAALKMGHAAREGAAGYIKSDQGQSAVKTIGKTQRKRSRVAGGGV